MKTDGRFEVASFEIPIRPNQEFRLVFWGDVHRDSPNHAHGAWQRFLTYAKGLKRGYFFGLGDYLDSTSSSERECLETSHFKFHETLKNDLQELQEAKIDLLVKELGFMKGRLIGLLGGNHYFVFKDRTTTDQRLCGRLDCDYLGCSAFVRLDLNYCGRHQTFDIFAHHGKGGGRLLGSSVNSVDQMREIAEADVFACGHDHKRFSVPAMPRLRLHSSPRDGLKVTHRQSYLIRGGSFLASYEPGESNYNVDERRPAASLGWSELSITPRRLCSDYNPTGNGALDLDIRTIS